MATDQFLIQWGFDLFYFPFVFVQKSISFFFFKCFHFFQARCVSNCPINQKNNHIIYIKAKALLGMF